MNQLKIPFRRLLFCLWIIQEAPCFIPCDYVAMDFVVFYHLYRWGHQKYPFVFLFIWALAFEVLDADKCCACSTHHEEYCDNFQQKFQPLMQFGPQTFFCHFSWSLSHDEHLLHLLTLMGDHCQHSCVQHGSVYAKHTPEIFPLPYHPPYACCNMINVAASFIHILFRSRHFQLHRVLVHTERTNNCCYAFICYEITKLFVWWWVIPTYETDISLMQQFL